MLDSELSIKLIDFGRAVKL
jgi:serine/threonine protein kinase